jgi:hypothetical protein
MHAHGAADKLIIQAPSLHIYMAVVNKHEEVTLSQKKKKKRKCYNHENCL